jgi:hypothetical protein
VAAFLANPCSFNGGKFFLDLLLFILNFCIFLDFDVPAIGPGVHYAPPDLTNICVCNTVIYSLLGKGLALCLGILILILLISQVHVLRAKEGM